MKVSRPFCYVQDVKGVLNLMEAKGEKKIPGFPRVRERFFPLDVMRYAFADPSFVRRSKRTEQSRQFVPFHPAAVTDLNSAAGLLTQYYHEKLCPLPLFSET